MNFPQLRYRIGIGGLPWVSKTALGVARQALQPAKAVRPAYELGSTDPAAPHILHLHAGWAIETVGRLWFTGQNRARFTFMRTADPHLTPEFINRFDLVWYGYSSLFRQFPCDPAKAILAVHDPAELFPERSDWKSTGRISEEKISLLRSAAAVVVISKEMEGILAREGIAPLRIPTRSTIPLRESRDITPIPPSFLGVGRIYRRKNFEQFKRLAMAARSIGCGSYLKTDHYPLSDASYIAMLDRHPIYLCTSFQEGGPLPVMDAMHRGAVVLTTPVGQTTEIIEHGVSGFICETDEEFLAVLTRLTQDPSGLQEIRRASLARIMKMRAPGLVAEQAAAALQKLLDG